MVTDKVIFLEQGHLRQDRSSNQEPAALHSRPELSCDYYSFCFRTLPTVMQLHPVTCMGAFHDSESSTVKALEWILNATNESFPAGTSDARLSIRSIQVIPASICGWRSTILSLGTPPESPLPYFIGMVHLWDRSSDPQTAPIRYFTLERIREVAFLGRPENVTTMLCEVTSSNEIGHQHINLGGVSPATLEAFCQRVSTHVEPAQSRDF